MPVAEDEKGVTLADHFVAHGRRVPRPGDTLPLGEIALVVHQVIEGRVVSIGLRLAELEPEETPPTPLARLQQVGRQVWRRLLAWLG